MLAMIRRWKYFRNTSTSGSTTIVRVLRFRSLLLSVVIGSVADVISHLDCDFQLKMLTLSIKFLLNVY